VGLPCSTALKKMYELMSCLAGYLCGSIPFAYIVTRRSMGLDIREVDIGNMGAGAVIRTVGVGWGVFVGVGDIVKGFAPVMLAQYLDVGLFWVYATGFAAVIGHCYPLYIGFRGGHGVATLIGVFLGIVPKAMGLTLLVMGLVLLLHARNRASRRIFLAVAVSAPFLPALVYAIYQSIPMVLYSLALVGYVAVRNVRRLRHPRTITERLLGEMDDQ